MLAGILVLAVLEAYWPFDWDPPGTVTNDVRRTADGALTFGDRNYARTTTTPAWVPTVRRTGRIQVDVVARPAFPQRYDGASIVMLASDEWHTDFALGQQGTDLLLWLRRVGTNADGDPPFVVANTFAPGHWTDVRLTVRDDGFRVAVDGRTRLRENMRAGSLRTWDAGLMVLGDEVHGGRGWQGQIRRAAVGTGAGMVDYARPGALDVPRRYLYLPDHVSPFPPPTGPEWLALVLHLVSFVPIGFLLVWCRRRSAPRSTQVVVAAAIALGIAVALAAGKPFFMNRHLAVADLVVQVVGALVGAYAAVHWATRRLRPPTGSGRGDLAITERPTCDEIR